MKFFRLLFTNLGFFSIYFSALSNTTSIFYSLTDIINYHINDIENTEVFYNQSIRRESPIKKTLLWADNLPIGFHLNDNFSLISQETLSGYNCSDSLIDLIKSEKAIFLYAFDISLNADILLVRINRDRVNIIESEIPNIHEILHITRTTYDDYFYKLNENVWESMPSYELDNSMTAEYILKNNEIQFFISRTIPKAVEIFKSNGFIGIYLTKPTYTISTKPWIVTNYSINPNYLNNVLIRLPSKSKRIIRHRMQSCYLINQNFYNNLLDDYQATKLFILEPKYALNANELNISIALKELSRDILGNISLSTLSYYNTNFIYDPFELEWKEKSQ